jgi:hypothetical protein
MIYDLAVLALAVIAIVAFDGLMYLVESAFPESGNRKRRRR